jgi:hypothetical protein
LVILAPIAKVVINSNPNEPKKLARDPTLYSSSDRNHHIHGCFIWSYDCSVWGATLLQTKLSTTS